MNATDTLCSCGTAGCTQMIDPDVDGLDPQIEDRLAALETEMATAEMNAERLDDVEEGFGDSQRKRAAEVSAEIDKVLSDNHLPALDYVD